jgi:hypothetical protein
MMIERYANPQILREREKKKAKRKKSYVLIVGAFLQLLAKLFRKIPADGAN